MPERRLCSAEMRQEYPSLFADSITLRDLPLALGQQLTVGGAKVFSLCAPPRYQELYVFYIDSRFKSYADKAARKSGYEGLSPAQSWRAGNSQKATGFTTSEILDRLPRNRDIPEPSLTQPLTNSALSAQQRYTSSSTYFRFYFHQHTVKLLCLQQQSGKSFSVAKGRSDHWPSPLPRAYGGPDSHLGNLQPVKAIHSCQTDNVLRSITEALSQATH